MKNYFSSERIPFTQVANEVLTDAKISLAAKGMFAYLFSKPDEWQFSSDRIKNEHSNGKRAVLAAIKELEKNGYLRRERKSNGRVEYFLKHSQSAESALGHKSPSAVSAQGKSAQGKSAPVSNTDTEVIKNSSNTTAAETATVESTAVWIELEGKKVDAVAESIKRLAETVNPACSQHYARLTQRQPLQRLIDLHGQQTVFKIIALLPRTNRIAYLPSITTPAQLETKWAQLESGLYKLKHKSETNAPAMAGLEDVT